MNRLARKIFSRSTGASLVVIAACALAPAAQAQQVKPVCTENSRVCLIATAKLYLESIVRHDGSRVPVAPNVKRVEQGKVYVRTEAELRESQAKEPDMLGAADTRFYVDEQQHTVIYFTLLRLAEQPKPAPAGRFPLPTDKPMTIHLAERIKVEHGLITEIEALFYDEIGTSDGQSGFPVVPDPHGGITIK